MELKVKKLHEHAKIPFYANEGDAAFDLSSIENIDIPVGEKRIVKTGISMAIPKGFVGLIWDRSGMAAKHDIHAFAGVIDSGYRGEIKVILKNFGDKDFNIEKGMRIAQMLIQPHLTANLKETDDLENTERGEGGFGSSGMH